jgi:hypothetical protein
MPVSAMCRDDSSWALSAKHRALAVQLIPWLGHRLVLFESLLYNGATHNTFSLHLNLPNVGYPIVYVPKSS